MLLVRVCLWFWIVPRLLAILVFMALGIDEIIRGRARGNRLDRDTHTLTGRKRT